MCQIKAIILDERNIDNTCKFIYAKSTMKKKHKLKITKTAKRFRGALGAGMAYAILGMLVIASAAVMMTGNIAPTNMNPDAKQKAIIMTNTPEPAKKNLQLYTFPGATYTPTPSPTPTPTPTDVPQQPGGNGNGDGNSAPNGNGNGNSSGTAL